MLKAIKTDEGLLTDSNVDEHLNTITEKSLGYDLVGLNAYIEANLQSKKIKKIN